MPFLEVVLLFFSYSTFLKVLIPLGLVGIVAFLVYSNTGVNVGGLSGIFSGITSKINTCLEYIRRFSGK
jgi:hypothetical protein